MDRLQPFDLNETDDSIEFDRLCEKCAAFFDGINTWPCYYSTSWHHDIAAVTESAARRCHLCSLLLDQLTYNPCTSRRPFCYGDEVREDQGTIFLCIDYHGPLDDPDKDFSLTMADGPIAAGIPIVKLFGSSERGPDGMNTRSVALWNCKEATLTQIRKWTDECVNRHEGCLRTQRIATTRQLLPTRLLDVASLMSHACVRLVSTGKMHLNTPYVTLSHCWGGSCAATLSTANMQACYDGIPVSSLPQTFRDAVIVTMELGISYLWIDALCIVQDSRDDWEYESSLMGDIYANSHLTIAATASRNSDSGLFYQRSPLAVQPCKIIVGVSSTEPDHVIVGLRDFSMEGALHDRAWAAQEWLLSKRLVHFSRDQVRWSCHRLRASELLPEGFALDDTYMDLDFDMKQSISSLSPDVVWWQRKYRWSSIRGEYSHKKLTKASDRLTAFSGIARTVHKLLDSPPEDYCAGLWKPELLLDLLWISNHEDSPKVKRSTIYVAPTWSWASLDCGFLQGPNLYHAVGGTQQWLIDVLESSTEPVKDVFGAVRCGRLVVRSSLHTASNLITAEDTISWPWHSTAIERTHAHIAPRDLKHFLELDYLIHVNAGVYFMPVLRYNLADAEALEVTGLMLQPTQARQGQYYRVGVLTIKDMCNAEDLSTKLPSSVLKGRGVREDLYVRYQGENCGIIEIV